MYMYLHDHNKNEVANFHCNVIYLILKDKSSTVDRSTHVMTIYQLSTQMTSCLSSTRKSMVHIDYNNCKEGVSKLAWVSQLFIRSTKRQSFYLIVRYISGR